MDAVIVGTGTDHYIHEVSCAKQVNLRTAEAVITPEAYTVRQNGRTVAAETTAHTVAVSISSKEQTLAPEASAVLRAQALFADDTATDRVYWISSDPEIAVCEAGDNGTCKVTAVGLGEAELYAVAEDSGFYAVCKVTVQEEPEPLPFVDVPTGKYYYEAVRWAYFHTPRVTSGTDATHFSPNATCTRAEVVTFLWAAKGKPDADWDANPFVDVKKSKFYFKPVLWAYQNGITSGTDATHFNPNGKCTRAQVVTFLWAMNGKPEPKPGNNPFKDVKKSNWYYKAVLWAYQNGITKGTDQTHFSPTKTCTRAEVVTFLYKACVK